MKTLIVLIVWFTPNILLAQKPRPGAFYYQAGSKLKSENKYTEAKPYFHKAVALDPKYDSAWVELGFIAAKENKYDSSLYFYGKALQISPAMALAYRGIADANRFVKSYTAEALKFYLRSFALEPLDKETAVNIAWCYNALAKLDSSRYDSAQYYANRALAVDNNYKNAYAELSFGFYKRKRFEEGYKEMKRHLDISVSEMPLYYAGLCLVMLERREEARGLYDKLLPLNPQLAESLKRKIEPNKQ